MSRAVAVINALAERDVLLSMEAGQLVIDAPLGVLSDQEFQEIQDLLPALLAWIPENSRPLPWRSEVAQWPVSKRLRWGRRANRLEGQGVPWYLAEARAFDELRGEPRSLRTRGRARYQFTPGLSTPLKETPDRFPGTRLAPSTSRMAGQVVLPAASQLRG